MLNWKYFVPLIIACLLAIVLFFFDFKKGNDIEIIEKTINNKIDQEVEKNNQATVEDIIKRMSELENGNHATTSMDNIINSMNNLSSTETENVVSGDEIIKKMNELNDEKN